MSFTFMMAVALLVVTQVPPSPTAQSEAASVTTSLTTPTLIRIDFENRTLAEIVAAINAQAPASVMLPPEPMRPVPGAPPRPVVPERRWTLREPAAVPFWEAIDRICHKARRWPGIAVMRDPSAPLPTGGGSDPRVVLVPASGDGGFAYTNGAFRLVLARLSYGRDIRFTPPLFPQPGTERSSANRSADEAFFSAEVIIMAEPRLKIERLGDLTVHEAIDDRGQRLIIAAGGRQPLKNQQGLIPPDAAAISVPLALRYPGEPGKRIKRLRGSIPLEVAGRRSGPQVAATVVTFEFADIPMP